MHPDDNGYAVSDQQDQTQSLNYMINTFTNQCKLSSMY